MNPTEDDLARAYRENAEHARETNEEWTVVSKEASDRRESHPDDE